MSLLKRILLVIWGIVVLGAWSGMAWAGTPTDQIRETTEKIIKIVSDPALKGEAHEAERRHRIREVVDERFDWEEMSRRTLGRHWRKRSAEEKKEFIKLFGDLLERTYLDRVEGYSGEKVFYEGDDVEGEYGIVRVRIVTQKETEIPVRYRVKKKAGIWYVYDISIQGVSLINNYRKQFNSIIVGSSYRRLVKKLKAKVESGT